MDETVLSAIITYQCSHVIIKLPFKLLDILIIKINLNIDIILWSLDHWCGV